MNTLKMHKRLEQIKKRKKATCPFCESRTLLKKWGATGPNPQTKIYIQKCPKCLELITEYAIIKKAIEENIKVFQWLCKIYHSQDSVSIIHNLTGAQKHNIVSTLLHNDCW